MLEIETISTNCATISFEIEGPFEEPTRYCTAHIETNQPSDDTISRFPIINEVYGNDDEQIETEITINVKTTDIESLTMASNLEQLKESITDPTTSPVLIITTDTYRQLIIITKVTDSISNTVTKIIVKTCKISLDDDSIPHELWETQEIEVTSKREK